MKTHGGIDGLGAIAADRREENTDETNKDVSEVAPSGRSSHSTRASWGQAREGEITFSSTRLAIWSGRGDLRAPF
jgi:hypothetical protein